MKNRLPEVGGRRLEVSLADFERSCLAHIGEMQELFNPDAALIALLCNAVRLARECADNAGVVQTKRTCQCQVYETCDICRAKTDADLRRLRQTVNTYRQLVDDGAQNDPHERLS